MSPAARPIGRALSAPRRGLASFFRGLSFPFRGARLVHVEHPGLVRLWIVPVAVTLLALVGSVAAVVGYHDVVTSSLWSAPSGEGWSADLARIAHGALDVLVVVVLSIAALAATVLVSGIVAAPFNGRLAEVLDERVTGRTTPPFSVSRALRDVARAVVIETAFFAINALLVVISLVFPAASPITGAAGVIFACLYFAIAYLETPQASRGRSLGDRLRLVARHPMALLGFGTGVGLFLLVPLVNVLFMPSAVAGGVLLHAALEADSNAR